MLITYVELTDEVLKVVTEENGLEVFNLTPEQHDLLLESQSDGTPTPLWELTYSYILNVVSQ